MSRLLRIFGASLLLFSALSACGDGPNFDARDNDSPAAGLYAAKRDLGSMPLDGRSLIDSWFGKRESGCETGYSLCPDETYCCPTGDGCCSTNGCVSPGGTCCQGGYTCPSGWDCCTEGFCYPTGGQCCGTGYYCMSGNQCVLVDGVQKCCTNDLCTAYVDSGVTITATGVGASSPTATGVVTVTAEILVATTHTTTSPAPTSTSTATPTGGGYSTSDKIALGCGIGIGLPATLAGMYTMWWQCTRGQSGQ